MHILIVKLGAIGDIIHALPAAAAVRRHLPDAEISWVAEKRSAEILRQSPVLNNLIEIDTRSLRGGKIAEEMFLDLGRQFKEVRQFRYDVALDMQGLLKSAVIARVSGAGRRWGFGKAALREPASRFLLTDTVDIPPRTHVVAKNMLLASKALDFEAPEAKYEFPIAANDEYRAEANTIAEQAKGRFALLNPAGGWVTKLWHAEKYGALADRLWEELGIVSIVATGPAESELAERVVAGSATGKIITAEPSLKGFYELAKQAAVYVGGDTGPTHLAIAAEAPVVGIFGPTEWWRNGSTNPDDICVERTDIDCRVDCHRRTCDKWICMDISVETVFNAVAERLSRI